MNTPGACFAKPTTTWAETPTCSGPRSSRAPPHEIKLHGLAEGREAPPDYWPLVAGDAIQNLRSALDHVVYAAASSDNERTQFPIFTDPDVYKAQNPNWLKGVPDSVKATIENAQPNRRFPTNPAVSGLEQLRELSNLDKHRTLTTVASAVQHEGVGVPGGVNITWEKPATGSTLGRGETHVSTFTASSETEISEADIEPLFTYEVRIEGRRLSIFTAIVREAWPVLVECETGEPLSPFAQYPLPEVPRRYRPAPIAPERGRQIDRPQPCTASGQRVAGWGLPDGVIHPHF